MVVKIGGQVAPIERDPGTREGVSRLRFEVTFTRGASCSVGSVGESYAAPHVGATVVVPIRSHLTQGPLWKTSTDPIQMIE